MEKYIALSVKCPHCEHSLMNPYVTIEGKPSVKLEIGYKSEKGIVYLCSYYGCTKYTVDINTEDKECNSFFCPHCQEQLISENECKECNAPMVPFKMEKGGLLHMCSRKGCNSHFLNFRNVSDALGKMYNEFGYF